MVGRVRYLLFDICSHQLLNKFFRSFASKARLSLWYLIRKEERLYSITVDLLFEFFQAFDGKVSGSFLDEPQKIASPTAIADKTDMNEVGHLSHIESKMIVEVKCETLHFVLQSQVKLKSQGLLTQFILKPLQLSENLFTGIGKVACQHVSLNIFYIKGKILYL